MSDEGDLEDNRIERFPWQPHDNDDDQVVPDFDHMTMSESHMDHNMHGPDNRHVIRHTSTPLTRPHHVSYDSGYQSSPNVTSRDGTFLHQDTEYEDVFAPAEVINEFMDPVSEVLTEHGGEIESDLDSESASMGETEADSAVQFDDGSRHEMSLGANTSNSDISEASHSNMGGGENSSDTTVLTPQQSPIRGAASQPPFTVSSTQSYAGARPKTSSQNQQSIPVRQSHLNAIETVAMGIPLSPNTRTDIYNQLGHSYGTPPRAYPFNRASRRRNLAEGDFMSQLCGPNYEATPLGHDVRRGLEASLQDQQQQFNQGLRRLQEKDELHPDHRPRFHSVVNAPDLSQLDVANDNHTPLNGMLRQRQRSNSAPAAMTLERAFGRELRRISDEFDEEHQTTAQRTRTRLRPRRSSSVYQQSKRASHRLSFPGAEGQEVGWWQHIVQWIPIPGYAGSPLSRHRTDPFSITDHVSEEEESNASDELDGLSKSDDKLADDPLEQVEFSLDTEDYNAEELAREETSSPDSQIQFSADADEDTFLLSDQHC